jgi:hypothetical protein
VVASDFVAFSLGGSQATNTQIAGRVAAGGDVSLSNYGLGSALPFDPGRVDLIVGGNLAAANGSVQNGGVTYAGSVSGQVYAAGPVRQANPPFDFDEAFAVLRERSAQWFDLPANGSISGPTYGALTLSGADSDPDLKRFRGDRRTAAVGAADHHRRAVTYRVIATSRGAAGAEFVRVCSRPPRALLVRARPRTFRYRGKICRDLHRLRRAGAGGGCFVRGNGLTAAI